MSAEDQLTRFGSRSERLSLPEEAMPVHVSCSSATLPHSSRRSNSNAESSANEEEIVEMTSEESDNTAEEKVKEEEPQPTVKSFGRLIKGFASYLSSRLGQELDKSTITQHIVQLKNLMTYSGIKHNNYRQLFDASLINKTLVALRKSKKKRGQGALEHHM